MKVAGSVALVTGANRGIGAAFIPELLKRGAKKVYAAARNPADLADVVALDPARVVPVTLDVTKPEQCEAAAPACASPPPFRPGSRVWVGRADHSVVTAWVDCL